MKLVKGLIGTVKGLTTIGSLKCEVVRVGNNESVVTILQGVRKGTNATVLNSQITILDSIENQIQFNTQTLCSLLSENGFDFSVDGFGDSNYITVETFSYRISICVDESEYSVDMVNLNRKEYGVYEDESKNHRRIKKSKTVLKYVSKFDK